MPLMLSTLVAMAVAGIPAQATGGGDDAELHAKLVYRIGPALPGCWDEAEFRRRISRRTGFDPFHDDAPVSVHITLTGSTSAIGGRVEWKDAKSGGMGERRFVAKDGNCGKLLAEISFAVALQIEMLRPVARPVPPRPDPDAAAGDAGAQSSTSAAAVSESEPPQAPKAQPAATEPRPPQPARPEKDHEALLPSPVTADDPALPAPAWRLAVGFGPSVAWGLSPSSTADLRMFFVARRNALSLELGGDASYASESVRWHGSGFRSRWIGAAAALCGHVSALSACFLGKAGELRIAGLGVDSPEEPSSFVAYTGVRIGATAELGKAWFVTARLDGLWLITPHTVQMNDVQIWSLPRASELAGIDLGFRFR